MKRGFDFVAALLGLVLLSPLFAVLGILIRLEDDGPVFFKHPRIGKGGKTFRLIKFRSMRQSGSENDGSFEPGNLSRVTSIGKFLRRTKLDELPQLVNVIKGDMSLVGPRPEIAQWVSEFPEKWKVILTVRPGITDVASLKFRNEESILEASPDPETLYKTVILPKKLEYCEHYVRHHSFGKDLIILIKTLFLIYIDK